MVLPRMSLTRSVVKEFASRTPIEANLPALKAINAELAQKFTFSDLDVEVRKDINDLFVTQFDSASPAYQSALLELVRILCRDKTGVNLLFSDALVEKVLQAGGIFPGRPVANFNVVTEAVKCLVNALFNSVVARSVFEAKCEGQLVARIETILEFLKASSISADGDAAYTFPADFEFLKEGSRKAIEDLLFFDLRIAFVSSAHSIELQRKWVENNEKAKVFLDVLSFATKIAPIPPTSKNFEYATEALKILFNVYCHASMFDVDFAQTVANECARIVLNHDFDDDLKQNAVHLIATMPCCMPALCPLLGEEEAGTTTKIFEGYDMRFVDALLEVLARKVDKTGKEEVDLLSTFFTTLIYLCKNHKAARRFCRLKVIPPLRASHVEHPPDEGVTLRNKIVRLMLSPTNLRDLAGEFLFVLCKRSVSRLIKYTGFGHSAGLLANYGFLGSINEQKRESDSEASDMEDYKEVEDKVNPVTGYIIPPQENPLDNMSEAQKEFEAMKLANAMNRLLDEGVFQPASVGPDGKPRPVSHVNELVKDIPDENSDSDSD
uniref:Synembryn-A n=1 Tax=Panagrellus redivivus TaxID=6233 RepID=A0A7E4UQ17_PANRE